MDSWIFRSMDRIVDRWSAGWLAGWAGWMVDGKGAWMDSPLTNKTHNIERRSGPNIHPMPCVSPSPNPNIARNDAVFWHGFSRPREPDSGHEALEKPTMAMTGMAFGCLVSHGSSIFSTTVHQSARYPSMDLKKTPEGLHLGFGGISRTLQLSAARKNAHTCAFSLAFKAQSNFKRF